MSEGGIYKRLLAVERLDGAAAWLAVVVQYSVTRFRVKLSDGSQADSGAPVGLVQRFTENELAAVKNLRDWQETAFRPAISVKRPDRKTR